MSPNVITEIGIARTLKIGLIVLFKNARTIPATTAVGQNAFTETPGTNCVIKLIRTARSKTFIIPPILQ